MKVVYKRYIIDELLRAIRTAEEESKEISYFIITDDEWERLKRDKNRERYLKRKEGGCVTFLGIDVFLGYAGCYPYP